MRLARPEEYGELARLTVDAYRQYAADLGPEHWDHYAADLSDVAGRAARGQILLAEAAGHVAGTVTYYPPEWGDTAADTWWPRGVAYLRALGVHPDWRGQGIGRILTLECVERARLAGAHGIALNTTSVMAVAQRMYESMGFIRQGGGRELQPDLWLLRYVLALDPDKSVATNPSKPIPNVTAW